MDKIYINLRKGILGMLIFLFPLFSQATSVTSRQTGNWNDGETWIASRNGTITTSTGSTTVTGVGTLFTTQLAIGDKVYKSDGSTLIGTVLSISNNTSLTLTANAISTNSGIVYTARKIPEATDDVTISSGHTVTVTANTTCNSISYLSSGSNNSTVSINSGITLTVSGTITIPRQNSNTNTMAVGAGNLIAQNIAFTNGGGAQRHVLTISTGTVTVTGNITQSGSSGSATITFTGSGLLKVGGTFLDSGTGTFTASTGTVEYNGAGAQTIGDFTYFNLVTSNAGIKSMSDNLTANGNITIGSSTTLNAGGNSITLKGNWSNSGTLSSSNTVTFNGSSLQTISGVSITTFTNLVLSNSSGIALQQDAIINTKLTLTSGRFNLRSRILTFGTSASAVGGTFSASNMIVASGGGEVRKSGTTSIGATYVFPVGDTTGTIEYSPISLTFTGGSYSGFASVKLKDAKHPNDSSAINFISRYWTIATSSYSGFNATIAATYVNSDINGTEANILMGKWNGSLPWQRFPGSMNTVTNTLTVSGITSFSDFTGINAVPSVITINASPNDTVCKNSSLILTASATGDQQLKYSWSPGGATTASINPSTATTGLTTYSVTVTDGNGQTNTSSITIFVNPLPSINVNISSNPICYGDTATLTATGANAYVWNSSPGLNSTIGATVKAWPTISSTYTVTGTSTGGCSNTGTASVVVNSLPVANAGADRTLTCVVTQVNLNGTSTTPGVTFAWVATNGGVIFSGANTANPLVQVPGTYVLTVTNPVTGCKGQDDVTIFQNINSPNANAGTDTSLTCALTSIVLNGSSLTPNTIFNWTTSDGNIVSGGTTLHPTINSAGSYLFTVTDTINGCMASNTVKILLNNTPPNINAGPDKFLTCVVSSVTLQGSSSTNAAVFNWSTSNGNIVGGTLGSITAAATGTYLLTVTDPTNGCSAKDSAIVMLNNTKPNVYAGVDTTLTCNVTSIVLHGSSTTSHISYNWATGSGNIVSGNSTLFPTINADGKYVLTITDSINGCSASDSLMVIMDTIAPIANAGPDKTLTCTVTQVTLNGSSSSPRVSYAWVATNGGIVFSGANTATPLVQVPGNYILKVTDTISGCAGVDSATVFQNINSPNANAGADTTLTCSVTSLALNGSSFTPNTIFSWSTLDGNIVSGASTQNPIVDMEGTYLLTVKDTINGCLSSSSAEVFLNNTIPNVNAGPDSTLTCVVTSLILNGSSTTPGALLSWSTANGNITASTLTSATINSAGTYTLTVANPVNGCIAKDSAQIMLNNTLPDVSAGADTVINCNNVFIALNGSSTTSNVYFNWTSSNGNISSGATSANPIVNAGGTYNLFVTDSVNGCIANDSVFVLADFTPPNVNAGSDDTLTCAVTQLALNGSSITPGAAFAWTVSNGGVILSGEDTATPLVQVTGTYILTVTNPVSGCTAIDSVQIFQDIIVPDVDAGVDTTLTCAVTSIVLNGTSSTAYTTYSWSTNDGNILSGATTLNPTIGTAGNYLLTVTNTINGCKSSNSLGVFLNNTLPNVNAGYDTTLTCAVTSVNLNGTSATGAAMFNWTTTGGNIVTGGSTGAPAIDAAGTYVLTVTDPANGCSAKDSALIILNNIVPDVNAGADSVINCINSAIALNGSSTSNVSYNWSTLNGNILSGSNTVNPTVNAAGTYKLTVTDIVNGCSASDSANVTVNVLSPAANAGNDTTLTCIVTSIVLNGNSSIASALYSWTTNDGNIVSGASTLNPTIDAAGTYMLTITNTVSGCQSSDVVTVTLNNTLPTVYAGADTMIGCGISTVMLHAVATGNLNYNWTTNTGNIVSGAGSSNALVDAAGVYIITVTDQVSGCSAKDSVMVGLGIQPIVDLGNDTTIVTCQAGIIIGATIPGMTYSWSTGATTATILAGTSGTYYLTVTNTMGCTASDTIMITLVQGAIAVDLGRDTSFMNCHAPTLTLDAGNQGATYLWSTAESTQSILVSTSGMYYVNVTDNRGCSGSDTINVNVINNNIDVNLGNDTTVCSCIALNAGNPGASYLWCSGQEYPQINACSTGTYCVTVSNGTCMDADTIHVTVVPPPVVNLGNDTTIVSGTLILNAGNPGAAYLWSTGDTTQTIGVVMGGTYYVTVTNAAGCSVTDTINVNVEIGIQEPTGADISMNLYPNPSIDKKFTLSFHIKDTADVVITITDVVGNVIYSEALPGFTGTYQKEISLERIANGIYFTHILSGKQKSTAKIILQ